MKKTVALLFAVFSFVFAISVSSAEIYEAKCNKSGVMQYLGNGSQKGTVDELFQFSFYVSGDTKQVLMKGAGDRFVVAKPNKKYDEPYAMATIEYCSNIAGTREFSFWAEGYDGSITEYPHKIYLEVYPRDNSKRTVYSVKTDNDVYQVYENIDYNQTRINIEVCTSINTCFIRMKSDNGAVVDNIDQYASLRGTCDIRDGKKYWTFYMQSSIVGDRTWTFQALDNKKNPEGDIKTVKFKVVKPEYFETEVNLGGPSGAKPGTGEGKTEGDDQYATGNEDGVDYGGDGKNDFGTHDGSDAVGDKPNDSTSNGTHEEGSVSSKPVEKPGEKPSDKPDEEPEKEPEEKPEEEKEQPKPSTSDEYGSKRIYDKNLWTYEYMGFGNCCLKGDFYGFSIPSSSKTIVIEFPDGTKINALDQLDKGLAIREESKDGKYTFWDIWTKGYDYNDLKVTVYDENYDIGYSLSCSKAGPFREKEQRMFDEAVYNEYLLRNFPKKKVITLTIGDEFMTIDGKKVEVDPGRGTKPLIIDGRTLLPIRAIVEALGGEIFWTASERKVSIDLFNRYINFWIGKDTLTWDDIPQKIDVPAQIINDRTMIPIRALTECLENTDIEWDARTRTVTITYKYI